MDHMRAWIGGAHGRMHADEGAASAGEKIESKRRTSDSDVVAVLLCAGRHLAHADGGRAASNLGEGSNGAEGVLVAEGSDLDRERERRAQALAQLGVVNDADELFRHHLHHLLAEERTAATLDKRKVGVNGIGAVDRDVELRLLVERAQGDAEGLGLLLSRNRGGNADDVLELARLELLSDTLHGKGRGRPGPKAHHHAALDKVVDGLIAGELLRLSDAGQLRGGGHAQLQALAT